MLTSMSECPSDWYRILMVDKDEHCEGLRLNADDLVGVLQVFGESWHLDTQI